MKNISKPVIIIGSGRSGTTIISEIVFRHEALAWPSNYQEKFPSVTAINLLRNIFENKLWRIHGQKPQLNEVSAINKMAFKPAEAYNFWEHITGPHIDFSRGFLLNDTATPEQAKKIRNTFSKLVSYQFKKRLAFKITGPSRIGYLTSIFPDAIFVNIVRDPLPTINSWLNVEFWQEKGKHQLWWQGAYSEQEQEWASKNGDKHELLAAMQYKKLMDTTAMEIKKYNANCLTVHYEEFVQNPAAVINKILEFTELGRSAFVEKYLQGIKIYNQNKNEALRGISKNNQEQASEMQLILNGAYGF